MENLSKDITEKLGKETTSEGIVRGLTELADLPVFDKADNRVNSFKSQTLDNAQELYQKAKESGSAEDLSNYGNRLYVPLHLNEESLRVQGSVLRVNSQYAPAYHYAGRILMDYELFDQALALFYEGLRLESADKTLHSEFHFDIWDLAVDAENCGREDIRKQLDDGFDHYIAGKAPHTSIECQEK